MSTEIINVASAEEFDSAVSSGLVLADFWAPWCMPCRMQGPILEDLAKSVSDIKIVKIDVENVQGIAPRFKVQGIPALIILKDGKEVKRFTGRTSKETLKAGLAEFS
jgi:thioredoxin 1